MRYPWTGVIRLSWMDSAVQAFECPFFFFATRYRASASLRSLSRPAATLGQVSTML